MPNHYTTKVTVKGSSDDLKRFSNAHISILGFDFDTVIRMPDALRGTESSSTVADGLFILGHTDILERSHWGLSSAAVMLEYPWVKEAGVTDEAGLKKLLLERSPDCVERANEAVWVYTHTGFLSWYDWSVENWGTKWNSYAFKITADKPKELRFQFDTAWAPPEPVLKKLVEMYPTLNFTFSGRDEFERGFVKLDIAA